MRLLVVHNRYRLPGGEDSVVDGETGLLSDAGHEVAQFVKDNAELDAAGVVRGGVEMVWSTRSRTELRGLLRSFRPEVVHVHNTHARLSPAVYYACRDAGVPVVQTLHNYRLLCPSATFFRNGGPCEDCLGKFVPWPGIAHRCYRGSAAASGVVAAMLSVHRLLGTWTRMVDVYTALTEFARQKFIEGGLPQEKIAVKPNFVHPDPGRRTVEGTRALFVGRLSREKGILTLTEAWRRLPGIPLKIAGAGPLADEVARHISGMPSVELLGWQSRDQVSALMRAARIVVVPSEWYETFSLVIAEAYACGVPVVASRLGAMAEIVHDGETGLHFNPGDPEDLAAKVEWAWTQPQETKRMGDNARAEYEAKYTAGRNYRMLMEIYERAIEHARTRSRQE